MNPYVRIAIAAGAGWFAGVKLSEGIPDEKSRESTKWAAILLIGAGVYFVLPTVFGGKPMLGMPLQYRDEVVT